jgi:hypothetical protein
MGTVGTRGIRQLLVIAGALVVLASASASPARAGDGSLLGCGHQPVHPFLQWLDPLPYTLLPGADFESGAAGWTLTGGARVADGNEPFYVTRGSDSHSLLPPGSSATSPAMCVGLVLPVVRFFSSGGSALTLNGLTSEIALRFTPRGLLGSGTWRVDDVYVDPWKVI